VGNAQWEQVVQGMHTKKTMSEEGSTITKSSWASHPAACVCDGHFPGDNATMPRA
jgi:hypothetical protein